MSSDYCSLLSRYLGRSVCLTMPGQTSIWGRVASVCYDGVRLVDTIVVGELENPGLFNAGNFAGLQPPGGARSSETLIHINQILAVTCLDEDLPEPPAVELTAADAWPELLVEPIELSIGSQLLRQTAPDLREQIGRLRNQIAADLGLLLPEIFVRESSALDPCGYLVKLRGVTACEEKLELNRLLALETSAVSRRITTSPAFDTPFGLPGVWIDRMERESAEMFGYAIVDAPRLMLFRLDQLFRARAPQLFGRQQFQDLLDQVREKSPAIAEEVLPDLIKPRQLQKILRNLLREGVPVRDMETIFEALADAASETMDPYELTERVRQALSSALCQRFRDTSGMLYVVTLDPTLEAALNGVVQHSSRGRHFQLTAMQSESVLSALATRLTELRAKGRAEMVLTTTPLRAPLRALAATRWPQCVVLSHEEIEPGTRVSSIGMVFYSGLFQAL